jgi:urease alpha subunit
MLPFVTRLLALALLLTMASRPAAADPPEANKPSAAFDLIVRGGTLYDGTRREGVQADIGIRGDRIAAIGDLKDAHLEDAMRFNCLTIQTSRRLTAGSDVWTGDSSNHVAGQVKPPIQNG